MRPRRGGRQQRLVVARDRETSATGKATFNLVTEFPTACVLVFNGQGATTEVLLFIRMQLERASARSTVEPRRPTPTVTAAFSWRAT